MSQFNVQQNHPLIPNSNSYVIEKKFVSIHSEDRDIASFPSSSFFEIELPQDYENVQSIRLSTWSFPANYNVFSIENNNLFFVFKLKDIYDPAVHGVTSPLQLAINEALTYKNASDKNASSYIARIQEGFYNPTQMANELSAKMNQEVSTYIKLYFTKINSDYTYLLSSFSGYTEFVISYNSVSQKLIFGNKSSSFILDNSSDIYFTENIVFASNCGLDPRKLPDFSTWGLPAFIGFLRVSQESNKADDNASQFFYGDAKTEGDNGVWLSPTLPGATAWYIIPPAKINFMGPAYFYMEISGLNCIDETNPYNVSNFTLTTNQTNSRVKSSFAKIAIPTTPISQWFDDGDQPYKWYNPPADRIRRLGVKIRYHNGQLVNFGTFNYSFLLEFALVRPQIQTNLNKNIPYFSNSFS